MSNEVSIAEEVKALELDAISAQKWARDGKIEAWVHHYLLSGKGGRSNPAFSEGLKREQRWWNGPIERNLTALSPAVGTEPGMEYVVNEEALHTRTSHLARSFSDLLSLPPMTAEYRRGELSLRDGNTRCGTALFTSALVPLHAGRPQPELDKGAEHILCHPSLPAPGIPQTSP
jgi:hypothetical protein